MNTPSLTYDYYVLLPHASAPRLLLVASEDGWRLPHWHTTEQNFWQTVDHVYRTVRDRFAIDVVTLRCLKTEYDPAQMRVSRWYELENCSPNVTLSCEQWLGPEAVPGIGDAQQRALLTEWFQEAAEGVPPQRRAWARRGWFSMVSTWIDQQLQRLGVRRVGHFDQLRTWERSCVLRVPTTRGLLYFKALPAMFAHEIHLIEVLAVRYPHNVVEVLAVDHERYWLLMADMGSQSLSQVSDLDRWEEALRLFARIQITSADMVEELVALGCPDRRIEALSNQIDPLLTELQRYPGLSAEDVAALHSLAPTLKEACAQLAHYSLPATLEHGDFWPSNVLLLEVGYVYLDWSDSSVAHPFFCLTLFLELEDVPDDLAQLPDLVTRLRDAYLEAWAAYAPPGDILAAFELAQAIAPLHHALTYHQVILPHLEARWELENMVGFYVRMLLQHWSARGDAFGYRWHMADSYLLPKD
jgi:hypothetical protein